MRTSPSPKQAAASPAAIDAQSRLRRFLPRNSFSADPERDFRDAHDLAVRLHDRWHGVNTEATDQEATLVEIETALMLRHRIERCALHHDQRSEEHTSELQSLMRISYAVFCLTKKKTLSTNHNS